jgi:hypothetical protein
MILKLQIARSHPSSVIPRSLSLQLGAVVRALEEREDDSRVLPDNLKPISVILAHENDDAKNRSRSRNEAQSHSCGTRSQICCCNRISR